MPIHLLSSAPEALHPGPRLARAPPRLVDLLFGGGGLVSSIGGGIA